MSDGGFGEKDEKEMQKREEKSAEEKWRRDPISALVWAGILIWAGLVLLADNLGLLDSVYGVFAQEPSDFPFAIGAWPLIFLGAGVILLGEVVIRLIIPEYRAPVTGTLILAFVFIGIGVGNWIGWGFIFPLIIIGAGLSILIRALSGPR